MGFEERAQGWLAWTRTPDHDAYWRYRDAFFALVPEPGAATLVSEAARVLAPGGRLCACITHPVQTTSTWEWRALKAR
jgi:hypothetical protein